MLWIDKQIILFLTPLLLLPLLNIEDSLVTEECKTDCQRKVLNFHFSLSIKIVWVLIDWDAWSLMRNVHNFLTKRAQLKLSIESDQVWERLLSAVWEWIPLHRVDSKGEIWMTLAKFLIFYQNRINRGEILELQSRRQFLGVASLG